MSVVRLWVYECCKIVGGTSCGLGGRGVGVPLVYECCKMVGGTSCGLGVGCTIKINNAKGTRSKKLKVQDQKS